MDQRSKRPLSRPAAARASTARRLEPEAVQTPKIVFTPCGKWIVRAVVPRLRANPFLGEAPVTRFEAMGEMFLHEAGPGAEKLRVAGASARAMALSKGAAVFLVPVVLRMRMVVRTIVPQVFSVVPGRAGREQTRQGGKVSRR